MAVIQCLLTLQPCIFAEITLCWQALLPREHAEQFPIGISSAVMNSFRKFLSQIDMSADVLRESDLLQETVSDVSEYMLHEANNPIDSGYHSPQPMVPANRDASSNYVSMVPVSANKVPCPFPKGGTLVDLPGNKNEVLSPVVCKAMGCPDVKFPGQIPLN